MVTIKEIAKMANVSPSTVSHVLNNTAKISGETKERVMKVVRQYNYKPNSIAKSLKMKKTNIIGVITEDITVFNTPEIINGINEYVEKCDYHMILNNIMLFKKIGNNYKDTSKYSKLISGVTDILLSKQVEGIIYVGSHCRDVTDLIVNLDIPIIFTYCYSTNTFHISINYDDEAAAYEITKYLIRMNHKKIGLITGRMDSLQCHNRLKGYCRALFENNILFNPQYLKNGDWEREAGYILGRELLTIEDRPTAIFSMNDVMAGGVIDAANELGLRIPADISLVGFDNRECSYSYTPKLTTMALPLNEMGRMSAEILIKLINKEIDVKENSLQIKCKLLERDSVAKMDF